MISLYSSLLDELLIFSHVAQGNTNVFLIFMVDWKCFFAIGYKFTVNFKIYNTQYLQTLLKQIIASSNSTIILKQYYEHNKL